MFGPVLLLASAAAQPSETRAGEPPRIVPRCDDIQDAEAIVVCGRRNEGERYRLPVRNDGFDPKGTTDSVSRERHRLMEEVDNGVGTCSNVGPSGFSGCFHRQVKRRCEQETCGISF